VNRRGEPVFFDLFDRASSPHVTIVGKTRRGKSSFLNTYISQVSGAYLTYILDRYGSYDELARRQHGTLVKFNPAGPVCIGPMDGPLDSRHRQHMAMIIEEMSMAGFRDQHVTPDERTLIGNLLEDWALKGPLACTMTDFGRYLRSIDDPFAKRLALLLGPYMGNGRYAPFTDGPNQLGIGETRLWVADIAGLEDFPDLQSIIIASLFTALERHLTNPEWIGTRKILAADEVSFLIRNPQAAEFLRKLAVALARFFASFVLISQSMSDFLTDLGSAAVKMADTHIFFNLGRQELHEISEVFKLSEHTADTIVNLRKYDDCSEAVIRFEEGEGGAGVIRVVPPPEFITAIGQSEAHRRARGEM
jgi:type IV secretory pathway VirB4 component